MFENIFRFIRTKFPEGDFYIVGGATRDYLLHRKESKDIDIATSLTPEQIRKYFEEGDYRFAKSGNVNYKLDSYHITLASFRREGPYRDYRHPAFIEFISSLEEDSKRRDFTINAIYFASDGTIIDPQEGLEDIKTQTLRMIGDPDKRLKEDPLRIVRAWRLAEECNLEIEGHLYKALISNTNLLEHLSPSKIVEEINKALPDQREKIKSMLNIGRNN